MTSGNYTLMQKQSSPIAISGMVYTICCLVLMIALIIMIIVLKKSDFYDLEKNTNNTDMDNTQQSIENKNSKNQPYSENQSEIVTGPTANPEIEISLDSSDSIESKLSRMTLKIQSWKYMQILRFVLFVLCILDYIALIIYSIFEIFTDTTINSVTGIALCAVSVVIQFVTTLSCILLLQNVFRINKYFIKNIIIIIYSWISMGLIGILSGQFLIVSGWALYIFTVLVSVAFVPSMQRTKYKTLFISLSCCLGIFNLYTTMGLPFIEYYNKRPQTWFYSVYTE